MNESICLLRELYLVTIWHWQFPAIYYVKLRTTDLINPLYKIHCLDYTSIGSLPIAVVHCCFHLEAIGENWISRSILDALHKCGRSLFRSQKTWMKSRYLTSGYFCHDIWCIYSEHTCLRSKIKDWFTELGKCVQVRATWLFLYFRTVVSKLSLLKANSPFLFSTNQKSPSHTYWIETLILLVVLLWKEG